MEDRFLARGSVDFGDFCLFVDEIAQFYSRSLNYSNWDDVGNGVWNYRVVFSNRANRGQFE